MPYDTSTDTAPDEALYTDSAGAAPPPETEEEAAGEGMEQGGEGTALLPTSFFVGKDLKPGDTCTVRVVRVHDDQVEVEYETSAPSGGAPAPREAPMPAEMASLMA